MIGKCIIAVCGDKVTKACGIHQLCSNLKDGIEGTMHSTKQMWDDHAEEDGWGILLVDAQNAFNRVNMHAMLWNVQHSWASGTHFSFNTYKHWSKLVLHGHKDLVFGKEGVTQGNPLAMILYALALLPVIVVLEMLLDDLTYAIKQLQKWFADDSSLAGFFEAIGKWYDKLCLIRPPLGYHPESEKSILITHEKNLELA
eukprot:10917853-Ditylum_brightwellii.AAC.1